MSVKPMEPAGQIRQRLVGARAERATGTSAAGVPRSGWLAADGPLADLLNPFRPLPPAESSRRARIAQACVLALAGTFIVF